METVKLKGKDFNTVHNALCELRQVTSVLKDVVKESLSERLQTVIKEFERGLEDAYIQDRYSFDTKMNYYHKFKEQQGLGAVWSIIEISDFDTQHPYRGAQTLIYRNNWGKPVYQPIQGDTWADLYRAADRCIRQSGDDHHIFIEGFMFSGDELLLTTGS